MAFEVFRKKKAGLLSLLFGKMIFNPKFISF